MCPRKPLHLSLSSRLLCPPLPCNLLFVTQLWAANRLQSFTFVSLCVYCFFQALDCCGRLCCAILCLPALDVASSSCGAFRFLKNKNCLESTVALCMQHGLALRRRSSSISLLAGEVGENGAYTWQRALTCTMKDASTQSSNLQFLGRNSLIPISPRPPRQKGTWAKQGMWALPQVTWAHNPGRTQQ